MLANLVLAFTLAFSAPPERSIPRHIPYGSIAPISTQRSGNFCTAFSINKEKGYWATAAHCLANDLFVGQEHADVIAADEENDLAVLRSFHTDALEIADETPFPGVAVYKWGYGNGWPVAWASYGTRSRWAYFSHFLGHIAVIFDLILAPGDSGSPIMTMDNKVVSIAEIIFRKEFAKRFEGVKNPGGGIDTVTLREFLEDYLPK